MLAQRDSLPTKHIGHCALHDPYVHMSPEDQPISSDQEWEQAATDASELDETRKPDGPDHQVLITVSAIIAVALYVVLGKRRSSM